jgi:hypothetical protein
MIVSPERKTTPAEKISLLAPYVGALSWILPAGRQASFGRARKYQITCHIFSFFDYIKLKKQ